MVSISYVAVRLYVVKQFPILLGICQNQLIWYTNFSWHKRKNKENTFHLYLSTIFIFILIFKYNLGLSLSGGNIIKMAIINSQFRAGNNLADLQDLAKILI